ADVFEDESGTCAAFIANLDDKTEKTVQFRNVSYTLTAWSVSILPDCKNVVFNTAKVGSQTSIIEMGEADFTRNGFVDHINTTKDTPDYLGIQLASGAGNGTVLPFKLKSPVSLKAGKNEIAILSMTVGLSALHVPQMVVGRPPTNSEAGTKLYVSNLDYEVTNEVLFSDVGELKRYSIHYDRSGRSKGTAEVVYVRHPDAVAAMKRYNNVQLDGKPMRLELVGVNIATPAPIPPMHMGILGNPVNSSRSAQGRIVGQGQDRGGDTAQRGSGNNAQHGSGRSRARPQKVSAADLDADLEKYRLERMHIK
ncbi:THO complex subunit 4B-like protein, partial [Tanacetum coccineum]